MIASLLEAALRGKSPRLMLTGASLPIPDIMERLRALTAKPVDFVDARSVTSGDQLRREVEQRVQAKNGALVFLTASAVSPLVRDVLDEALEGRVHLGPGSSVEIPEALPVLALVPTPNPDAGMRGLFDTALPVERALAPPTGGGEGLFSDVSN